MQMICVWKKYWKTFLSEVPHDRESQGWKTSFKWAIKLNLLLKDGNVSGTSYSSNDCSSVPNSPFTACSADIEMGPSSFRKTNKLRTPTDCTLCLSRDVSPHSLCCNKKPLGSISVPLCTSVIVLLTVCWIYHERHQSSGGDWASCYSGLPFVHTGVSKTICLVMSASEDATSVLPWTFSPQFLPHDGLFRLFSCVLMDTQVSSPLMVAFSAVHVRYNGLFLIQLYMSLILNCI
ncbi:uncharacterized protein LOC128929312 isoform X2 [Callithrix jacchus]